MGGTALAAEQAPAEQMALARTAIEQAQSAGATENAPVELKAAQDRFNQATALAAKERRKDYPQARRLAEEAESSARLALSMTTAVKAEKALSEVNQSIEVMRQEMQRPATP
jgi:hypothetical protein